MYIFYLNNLLLDLMILLRFMKTPDMCLESSVVSGKDNIKILRIIFRQRFHLDPILRFPEFFNVFPVFSFSN